MIEKRPSNLIILARTLVRFLVYLKKQPWIYPLGLAVGIRLILTLWLAFEWWLIDPYFPAAQEWEKHGFTIIAPQATLFNRAFIDVWLRWDAVKFIKIAQHGYAALDSTYYAFFPGFPYIVRWVTGWIPSAATSVIYFVLTSLAISSISTFAALLSFKYLVQDIYGSEKLSQWSMICWIIFPTSFFLFAPYSEALFSAFAIAALLFLTRRKWILAGFFSALAGFTRSQGILLVLPFAFVILLDVLKERRWPSIAKIIGVLLSPSGWLAYKYWMEAQVQNNLFELYSAGWKNSLQDPFTVFFHTLSFAFQSGKAIVFFELLGVIVFGLVILWMLWKKSFRASPALAIYTLATFGSLLVWDCADCSGYISILRYFISLFPVFIGFAQILLRLPSLARRIFVGVNFSLLLLSASLYALWVFVG